MREFITSHTSDPAGLLKNNSSVEDRAVNNGSTSPVESRPVRRFGILPFPRITVFLGAFNVFNMKFVSKKANYGRTRRETRVSQGDFCGL